MKCKICMVRFLCLTGMLLDLPNGVATGNEEFESQDDDEEVEPPPPRELWTVAAMIDGINNNWIAIHEHLLIVAKKVKNMYNLKQELNIHLASLRNNMIESMWDQLQKEKRALEKLYRETDIP